MRALMTHLPFAVLATLLLGAATPVHAEDPKSLWSAAAAAFQAGKYDLAAKDYAKILGAGIATDDIYFNLGTAQLRAGHRGAAILAFERALRVAPDDADAAFNLDQAVKGNVDKIVGAREEQPLTERLGARIPESTMGWIFVASWLLFWTSIIVRMFRRRGQAVLMGTAIIAAVVSVVSGALLGLAIWVQTNVRYAIVVSPVASVREGPASGFKSDFEIHEGLKVRVVNEHDHFVRIRLSNGVEGWVSAKDAPII